MFFVLFFSIGTLESPCISSHFRLFCTLLSSLSFNEKSLVSTRKLLFNCTIIAAAAALGPGMLQFILQLFNYFLVKISLMYPFLSLTLLVLHYQMKRKHISVQNSFYVTFLHFENREVTVINMHSYISAFQWLFLYGAEFFLKFCWMAKLLMNVCLTENSDKAVEFSFN